MLSTATPMARPKGGGALACVWKHLWTLIFFWYFLHQGKKYRKKIMRTPLLNAIARAEQIKYNV